MDSSVDGNSNLFLKFQNSFTAEFWAIFSYGLLLQRFFGNLSGIFIMSMKADTRNFSKKYQQNLLLDAIFFEHYGPFKRLFLKKYLPSEIGIFRTIAKLYLLFFAKFRSHRSKNETL